MAGCLKDWDDWSDGAKGPASLVYKERDKHTEPVSSSTDQVEDVLVGKSRQMLLWSLCGSSRKH